MLKSVVTESTIHYHNVNGNRVAFLEKGQGEPIMLLHCGGLDHRVFDFQIAHFSKTHRVIAPDLLGFGRSDKIKGVYTPRHYVDQVVALANHLQLSRFHLVGCCFGGLIAMEYAFRFPDSLKSLVIVTIILDEIIAEGVMGGMPKLTFGSFKHRLLAFLARKKIGQRNFEKHMKQYQLGEYISADPEWTAYCERYYRDTNHINTLINFNLGASTVNGKTRPEKFPPTLVLWGGKNESLPADAGMRWAEKFGADQYKVYNEAGYMVLRQCSEKVNHDIQYFLHTASAVQNAHELSEVAS